MLWFVFIVFLVVVFYYHKIKLFNDIWTLSKDKTLQNPENFKEGDVVEAKVTSVDKKNVKIGLSVKALELDEEKRVLEEYSNTSSGSSLGDALGEALKKAN